jgi:hypothetical protein
MSRCGATISATAPWVGERRIERRQVDVDTALLLDLRRGRHRDLIAGLLRLETRTPGQFAGRLVPFRNAELRVVAHAAPPAVAAS